MLPKFKQWLSGIEVSEISLVLPFVQITFKSSDEKVNGKITTQQLEVETEPIETKRNIVLNLKSQPHETLLAQGELQVQVAYRTVASIRNTHPYYYWNKWQPLQGEIELRPSEIVWFVTRYINNSGNLLYKLPVTMWQIPFLSGLVGLGVTEIPDGQRKTLNQKDHDKWKQWHKQKYRGHTGGMTFNQIVDGMPPIKKEPQKVTTVHNVVRGTILSHLNSNESYSLHCLCSVPSKYRLGSKIVFQQSNSQQNFAFARSVISQNYDSDYDREKLDSAHSD